MVGSFRETLEVWAKVRLRGDLFVSSTLDGKENESRLSQDVVEAVRTVPGVERVVPYYEARTTFHGSEVVVGASDLRAQTERGVFIVRGGKIDEAALHDGVDVLLSEGGARKLSLRPADSIVVEGRTLRIGAIIQEFGTELPLIQMEERLFRQLYPRHNPQSLTIDASSGASVEAVRPSIERIVGVRGIVRDNGELRSLVLSLFDRTFQVTSSIRWIVFTLGVVGLLLATLQHLWERRRELKTLHLMGMNSWSMVLAFVYEGALVCVLPVGVGVLGGVMMGWGLTHYVNPLSFGWSLAFSFSFYPVFISCLFVVAVACSVGISTALLLKQTVRGATFSDE
jgi:putative ABC transport system permease protein